MNSQLLNVMKYRGQKLFIPVSKTILADIKTSIEILRLLKSRYDKCYMLESVERGQYWGRYTFLGYDPKLAVAGTGNKTLITYSGGESIEYDIPVKDKLSEILAEHKGISVDNMPDFTGGLVGYFSYEFGNKNNMEGYNSYFMLFDKVIAIDHLVQKIHLIVNISCEEPELNYYKACEEIKNIEMLLNQNTPVNETGLMPPVHFSLCGEKTQFIKDVKTVKEKIKTGDIYQMTLTQKWESFFEGDLMPLYRVLRTVLPSAYMVYFDYKDMQIAGASPKMLFSINRDIIKSTILTSLDSNTPYTHERLMDSYYNSLSAVCKPNSINFTVSKQNITLSHNSYLFSSIQGKLRDNIQLPDIAANLLPMEELSGIPRNKSIQAISEIELIERGTGCAAIGYLDFNGNMELCCGLRLVTLHGNKLSIPSKITVTRSSEPEDEYRRCANKAADMINICKDAGELL